LAVIDYDGGIFLHLIVYHSIMKKKLTLVLFAYRWYYWHSQFLSLDGRGTSPIRRRG
jgi:hypothetical protein